MVHPLGAGEFGPRQLEILWATLLWAYNGKEIMHFKCLKFKQ